MIEAWYMVMLIAVLLGISGVVWLKHSARDPHANDWIMR